MKNKIIARITKLYRAVQDTIHFFPWHILKSKYLFRIMVGDKNTIHISDSGLKIILEKRRTYQIILLSFKRLVVTIQFGQMIPKIILMHKVSCMQETMDQGLPDNYECPFEWAMYFVSSNQTWNEAIGHHDNLAGIEAAKVQPTRRKYIDNKCYKSS